MGEEEREEENIHYSHRIAGSVDHFKLNNDYVFVNCITVYKTTQILFYTQSYIHVQLYKVN